MSDLRQQRTLAVTPETEIQIAKWLEPDCSSGQSVRHRGLSPAQRGTKAGTELHLINVRFVGLDQPDLHASRKGPCPLGMSSAKSSVESLKANIHSP